jgi:hypothetical protein
VVARIVLDELDTFWERVSSKLNELQLEEYDEGTPKAIVDAKGDIKATVPAQFGKPVSTVVTAKSNLSGCNLFNSENRQKVQEELESHGQRLSFPSCHGHGGNLWQSVAIGVPWGDMARIHGAGVRVSMESGDRDRSPGI